MRKQPSQAKLQKMVDDFNKRFPVGTPIMLKKDFVDEPVLTKVTHPAYIMSGHSAVAFFEGISGCYDVSCAQEVKP